MKINNFQGELTDISAKKEALVQDNWYWAVNHMQNCHEDNTNAFF